MKYDCDLIKDLLPLYHDKTTSDSSSKVVEEHLNECDKCRLFYQEVQKTTNIPFQPISKTDVADGYLSLAKRLRRTKWYWRLCIGLIIGIIIYQSLMYSDGNRFDAIKAAYASNVIDNHSQLMASVPMGDERILYIYDDEGIYQDIDVTYNFPYWKYVHTWPNRYIADPDAEVQLITSKTYANSNNHSLYIVYAVAVNDKRIAYIDLGKDGTMQRQNIDSKIAVFFWDETENWDGTDTWDGMINRGELQGVAYGNDGSILYKLALVSGLNGQDSYKWIPVE